MSDISIRPITPDDSEQITRFLIQAWGASIQVRRGAILPLERLPGFIASAQGKWVGLVTYEIQECACEITTINSTCSGKGIGTVLIDAVKAVAQQAGCQRLWLITTNDNLNALRFYQKRGFVLAALYPNALEESRKLKPQIPLIGNDGIPLRDEIELAMYLSTR
ncbi:MAG TPA: GNAT family N-acetyltransferase [Ktedonosporobacter sp.]|nr:GNAT family N-acetyltransferase [Ktedonosporobacter sp.]